MIGSDRMQINRFCSVIAILGVMIMTLAIAGCGTKTVSVAEVTYKDMPLQIHNDANVTALNKATITPTLTGQVVYAVKVGDQVQHIGFTTTASILARTISTSPITIICLSCDDYDCSIYRQYSTGTGSTHA